ncbi:MAG: HNH endonuclease [Oscillospiraceae bacterium]|nr:HNH endonuclease [Oscillospiraceae bacterium]
MKETWKDVPNTSGRYQISSSGNFRKKSINGEYIDVKPRLDGYGYLYVTLKYDDNEKTKYVAIHRLVAKAFINNPYNLPIVHHIDDNKLNNCVENLFWCTRGQNNSFSFSARKGHVIKDRVIEQYSMDGTLLATYSSFRNASNAIGIKNTNLISKCCRNLRGRKSAYGYIWRFGVGDKMYHDNQIEPDQMAMIIEAYKKNPNEVINAINKIIKNEIPNT